MGNLCGIGMGDRAVDVEADVCSLFSNHYREEGIRQQKQLADQTLPQLTDQDWWVLHLSGVRMRIRVRLLLSPSAFVAKQLNGSLAAAASPVGSPASPGCPLSPPQ